MTRDPRSWYCRLTFQREYKIGISTNPEYRRKKIQEDLDGKVRILKARAFSDAKKIERKLHRKFSDSNFRIKTKGKGQAGETEWFYMTDAEYAALSFDIFYLEQEAPIFRTCLFLIFLILAFAALSQ